MAPASRKGAAVSSKGRDAVAVEVLLPKIGLTMQEGTIDEWLVPTGGAVAEGDPLVRLATDKVDVDVEAEAGGLFHPVVPAGATVPTGAVIGWLLAEGEEPPGAGGTTAPTESVATEWMSSTCGRTSLTLRDCSRPMKCHRNTSG